MAHTNGGPFRIEARDVGMAWRYVDRYHEQVAAVEFAAERSLDSPAGGRYRVVDESDEHVVATYVNRGPEGEAQKATQRADPMSIGFLAERDHWRAEAERQAAEVARLRAALESVRTAYGNSRVTARPHGNKVTIAGPRARDFLWLGSTACDALDPARIAHIPSPV